MSAGGGVGAVVLAYGSGGEYLAVLESLAGQGVGAGQVIVVHNPSEPGERLPAAPAGCEVVSASHNLGYAAGMNLGIRRLLEGDAEFALLLTHDASLRPGALERLLGVARAEPRYGVLGPALMLTGSGEPFSFGGRTSPGGALSHLKERPAVPGPVAPCDWVDGGTMLVRAEALAGTVGFDERLWGYCEDADLCLRIERAGFRVGVVLDALADQAPGGAKRPGPWAYLLTRNGLAFAGRAKGRRGVASTLLRAAALVLSELARTLARLTPLRPGRPAETWAVAVGAAQGVVDFLRARWGPPPPNLPGAGDIKNLAPEVDGPETLLYGRKSAHQREGGGDAGSERARVLHVGPDVPGGMRTSTRALLGSRLASEFELESVVTHRGSGALRRATVFLAALWRLGWWSLRGRGRVVHVHATVRGSMYRKAACVLVAKALRRRVVLHVHSGPGDIASFRAGLGRLGLAFIRRAFRRADVVLAVSSASAAALADAFGAAEIVVVPNAVPVAEPGGAREAGAAGEPLAVYLGGFANPVKGGEVLLRALRAPEPVSLRFVLAGPGQPPGGEAGVPDPPPAVEWRGWLEEGEKRALLREADVFVLASTSEGLPMALLEAMSYGLAIVATAVGGVPDVVADGEQALVVRPDDAAALAAALGRLGTDPELRLRLGRAALARAADFSPDAVAERVAAVYRRLL